MTSTAPPATPGGINRRAGRPGRTSRTGRTGRARRADKPEISDRARSEARLGWLLCAPALLVMLAVTAYPVLYAAWLSLQRYDLRFPGEREYVWFANYAAVLSSPLWWTDLLATVVITVVSVAVELVLGLGLALVMHRAIFGRRTVRTSILIPYGIVTVVAAFAWQYAFTPTVSFFTDFPWLTERWSSFAVIIFTEVWKTTPFMSLLLLAGLATIPEEYQEAAKVDGATAWQRLWRVTLPNMKAAIMVALLFRTLDAFRIFDTVFIQTAGANNTETLSFLTYNQLINRVNLGLGSAVSVLLFVCVVIVAFVFVKGFRTDLGQVRGER